MLIIRRMAPDTSIKFIRPLTIIYSMFMSMLRVCHKKKIFYPVISFNAIDMMNNFLRSKIASEVFLHYKAMFINMLTFIRRVPWAIDKFISRGGKKLTAFPSILTSIRRIILTFPHLTHSFLEFFRVHLSTGKFCAYAVFPFLGMMFTRHYLLFLRFKTIIIEQYYYNIDKALVKYACKKCGTVTEEKK